MSDVLRGYSFDTGPARYRDLTTGKFVSRQRIASLMEEQIDGVEERMGRIVQAIFSKEIALGVGVILMRDELRRTSLQSAALARGGFDRLIWRDYGLVGRQLADSEERIINLMRDIQAGRATLPQALNRIAGYVGEARQNYLTIQRDVLRDTGKRMEARRHLGMAEHCRDCVHYAAQGWQPMEMVPLPGVGAVCGPRCRCSIEYREVNEERIAA